MSTGISPGGEGGLYVRLTTYHPRSAERQKIRGLILPGTPWATSVFCGRPLTFIDASRFTWTFRADIYETEAEI